MTEVCPNCKTNNIQTWRYMDKELIEYFVINCLECRNSFEYKIEVKV